MTTMQRNEIQIILVGKISDKLKKSVEFIFNALLNNGGLKRFAKYLDNFNIDYDKIVQNEVKILQWN